MIYPAIGGQRDASCCESYGIEFPHWHLNLPVVHGSGRNRLLRIGPSLRDAWTSTQHSGLKH